MIILTATVCVMALAMLLAIPFASAQSESKIIVNLGNSTVFDKICKDKILVVRSDGRTACVYPSTAERLEMRGWGVLSSGADVARSDDVITKVQQDTSGNGISIMDSDTSGSDVGLEDTGIENRTNSPYYDEELYHVAGGRITLEGLKELPNTRGFWSPYTRAYAEDVLMPLLAGAIGDKVILPPEDGTPSNRYYTEMGNVFRLHHRSNPDIIDRMKYEIEQNLHQNDFEEFVMKFADNAGLDVREPNIRNPIEPTIRLYSTTTAGIIYASNSGEFTQISVYRWSFDPSPSDWLELSREELEKRAYDFAARHTNIYDEEYCRFELREPWGGTGTIISGIPISSVNIGNCYSPDFEGRGPRSITFHIDDVSGTVIWPSPGDSDYLADDWFEKIKHDIPESALVTNDRGDR